MKSLKSSTIVIGLMIALMKDHFAPTVIKVCAAYLFKKKRGHINTELFYNQVCAKMLVSQLLY